MKMKLLLLCALLVALSAGAEETDPMALCDNSYTVCMEKCDMKEDVSSNCYDACDNIYQKCLDIANGYTPEPEKPPVKMAKKPEAKTPPVKLAKKAESSNATR